MPIVVVKTADNLDAHGAAPHRCEAIGANRCGVQPDPEFAGDTVMGKCYVDDRGADVHATMGGAGTLSRGKTPGASRTPNPLPASD
jgi:hypothetical protein